MPEFSIKRFNPKKMKPNTVALFLGRRGSGKTTTMEQVIYHHRNIPTGTIFSNTDSANDDWSKHFPDTYIYEDYDPDVAKRVILGQKRLKRKCKRNPRKKMKQTLVLLEDCMYDKNLFTNEPTIRSILMNGRHWGIFFFISVQYMMDLPRPLRTQFDYIFLFRDNDMDNRQKYWKSWAGFIPTFEAFNEIYKELTRGKGSCMVIDGTVMADNIEDCIFWYRAKFPPPSFKFGSKGYWLYHYLNEKTEEEKDMEEDAKWMEQLDKGTKREKNKKKYRIKKV